MSASGALKGALFCVHIRQRPFKIILEWPTGGVGCVCPLLRWRCMEERLTFGANDSHSDTAHFHFCSCTCFSKLWGSPQITYLFCSFSPNPHTSRLCLKLPPENESNNSFWTVPSSRQCLSLYVVTTRSAIWTNPFTALLKTPYSLHVFRVLGQMGWFLCFLSDCCEWINNFFYHEFKSATCKNPLLSHHQKCLIQQKSQS